MDLRHALTISSFILILLSCQTTYYSVWEKLGKEKRHLLKDQVSEARTEQEEASEEFVDVLTRIKEIYGFEGGDLEDFYNKLNSDYKACKKRAEAVDTRIEKVDRIATDLFEEWEKEIDEMANEKFRSDSMQSLRMAKKRYTRLNDAMTKAKSRMEPVLIHLKDYVLYLKHNLNAQAVGALKQEVGDIENEVEKLIVDIAKSVAEANSFLESFE